jgi:hypothetical protein
LAPTKLRPKIFLVIFLSVARADPRGPTYRRRAPGGPQRQSRGIEEKREATESKRPRTLQEIDFFQFKKLR